MKKIIGNEVKVILKNDDIANIYGILIDVTDDSIYVQEGAGAENVYAIPRENVLYCLTDRVAPYRQILSQDDVKNIRMNNVPHAVQQIDVYVNDHIVANIPVPKNLRVDTWNDGIADLIANNTDVQNALAGKVHKQLDYYPGEVYILVEDIVPPSQMPERPNTFSMNAGGSPMTEFLSPVEMAQRLKKVGGSGKKDD